LRFLIDPRQRLGESAVIIPPARMLPRDTKSQLRDVLRCRNIATAVQHAPSCSGSGLSEQE